MTTRTKYKRGLEKEPNTVYIGRRFGPFKQNSKWGNPFKTGRDGTIDEVLAKYEGYLRESGLIHSVSELEDKILICWCDDSSPCHGDILIKLLKIVDFGV